MTLPTITGRLLNCGDTSYVLDHVCRFWMENEKVWLELTGGAQESIEFCEHDGKSSSWTPVEDQKKAARYTMALLRVYFGGQDDPPPFSRQKTEDLAVTEQHATLDPNIFAPDIQKARDLVAQYPDGPPEDILERLAAIHVPWGAIVKLAEEQP